MKLNAQEMRTVDEDAVKAQMTALKRHPIYFILENIYDTYNVGGLFRLADAIGVSKMYLCGEMEIPPNPKIKKASIGTYKVVPWEYKKTVKEAVDQVKNKFAVDSLQLVEEKKSQTIDYKLQTKNYKLPTTNLQLHVVAIEQSPKSIPYTQIQYSFPVALILGNESYGVLPETLKMADHIAEIPMWGINKSLNVIVSAAIVSYWVMNEFVVHSW